MGLGMGILGTILIGLITFYCFRITIETAVDKVGNKDITLQVFASEVLGKKGLKGLRVCLIMIQVSSCIGLLIFIKNFLNHAVCVHGASGLCENMTFNFLISLLLIIPLSLINNLKHFNKPSIAAALFAIIATATLIFYSLDKISKDISIRNSFGSRLGEFSFEKFPLFFGVCTWAFEGLGILFNLQNSLKNPKDYKGIIRN